MTPKECEKIYREAYRAVYWTALALMKNEADAEDVVQETFVTLIEKYDTLQDKSKVVPWLKKICANKCLNLLTRTKTQAMEQEFFDNLEAVPEDFLPESIVESQEKRKIIMDIIERALSEDVRRTIILYYFDEMSTKEIAEAMGVPQGTVLWRLSFARAKIKKEVEKYEKDNDVKLYAVAVPFLTLLFIRESEQVPVPPMPDFMEPLSASTHASKSEAVKTIVTETVKKGTGIAMKKIIFSCVAVVVLGITVAVAALLKNHDEEPRRQRKDAGSVKQTNTEDGIDKPTKPVTDEEQNKPTEPVTNEEQNKPTEPVTKEEQYKQMIATAYNVKQGVVKLGSRTVYDYDSNGNMIRVEHYDKTGKMTYWSEYKYDENGRKIWAVTDHDPDEPLEPTTYDYELDEAGRVIKKTVYDSEGKIKNWREYAYDASGREIVCKSYSGNGNLYSWEETEIDEAGKQVKYITKQLDANGNPYETNCTEMEYECDEAGNITKTISYDNSGKVVHRTECAYDSAGNRIVDKQYRYSDGVIEDWSELVYDSFGNKLDEKYYVVQYGTEPKEYEIEYDLFGETLRVVRQKWNEYEYDDYGKLLRRLEHARDGQIDYRVEYEYKY